MRCSSMVLPALFSLLIVASGCGGDDAAETANKSLPGVFTQVTEDTFVGRASCIECHPIESDLYHASDHDLAMQPADAANVLGDFDDAQFEYGGVTSTFFRRGGDFFVRTDGPDGQLGEYRLAYTFGVRPLQQYLIEMPGGRLQALSLCWDTRPASEGGQRWFHLYQDENVTHRGPLHWTAPSQNWNHMCAECHSTNLRKNFDAEKNHFSTSWSEIDVSCEACHGPASAHVAWARTPRKPGDDDPSRGFPVDLRARRAGAWEFESGSPTAKRVLPDNAAPQVDLCGRCHSRRSWITGDYEHGSPLGDSHRVSLLEPDLYHPDGQILDEVYVYGSFLQSRMFAAGVVCTDCHDPHSTRPVAPGNTLCARCHDPSVFDTAAHHHHPAGSRGSRCVECHMRERNYMVVDPRRDHSFRVPRPDLTAKIGSPNACNDCHRDRPTEWAQASVREWYGTERAAELHVGEALHAARSGHARAESLLRRVLDTPETAGIVRASVLSELRRFPGPQTSEAVARAARDEDALVRRTSAEMLGWIEPHSRIRVGVPLLRDSIRTVRLGAATSLAGSSSQLSSDQRDLLQRAIAEWRAAQANNSDRADALVNLGNLEMGLGRVREAESAFRLAMLRNPHYLPAYVNLADLLRTQQRDDEGELLLARALELVPDNAEVHHALGLLLIRSHNPDRALEHLARAAALRPTNSRFAYVYAVALFDGGAADRSLQVLEQAHARHPADRDVIAALVHYNTELGRADAATRWERTLRALSPGGSGAP